MNSTAVSGEASEVSGSDKVAIDALIEALYEVISFDEGGEPDWQRMQTLFSPHARITRVTPDGTDYLDLLRSDSAADSADRARRTVVEMMRRGYYCCYSAFPAVPIDRPSLRFTLSRHNELAGIPRFVENLAEVVARRPEASSPLATAV